MIVSSTVLKNAVENYRRMARRKERFSASKAAGAGVSAAFASFTLVVAVLFFILELIVLFYAISMAVNCSKGGPERIVNVVLAVTFTIPYVMLNLLFNKCAKGTLRGESQWLPAGSPMTA